MSEGLQAILNDDGVFEEYDDTYDLIIHCKSKEEQEMAIKALEQEPCDKYIKEIDHLRKYICKLETQIVEQEPKTVLYKGMSNLEKAKEIIKANYRNANCGIYDCRNFVGDTMTTIYESEGLTIDVCYHYSYFEVFGLSNAEFEELEKYYNSLKESGEV